MIGLDLSVLDSIVLSCSATYVVVWCCIVLCSIVLHCIVLPCVVLCCVILYCVSPFCVMVNGVELCCMRCFVLRYTVHGIGLYCL